MATAPSSQRATHLQPSTSHMSRTWSRPARWGGQQGAEAGASTHTEAPGCDGVACTAHVCLDVRHSANDVAQHQYGCAQHRCRQKPKPPTPTPSHARAGASLYTQARPAPTCGGDVAPVGAEGCAVDVLRVPACQVACGAPAHALVQYHIMLRAWHRQQDASIWVPVGAGQVLGVRVALWWWEINGRKGGQRCGAGG